MPTAYSEDLREKVITFLDDGGTQSEAAQHFSIGRSSIVRWQKQRRETGKLKAYPQGRKRGTSRVDGKALQRYIEKNPDQKLTEIGRHFGVSGVMIWKRLKQLKYTFKKRPSATRSAMKPNAGSSVA